MDTDFWRRYLGRVLDVFRGHLVSEVFVHEVVTPVPVGNPKNSGAGAIALAHLLGAKRIILAGYDASWQGEKRHCHDDYPTGMGNAGSVGDWPTHFRELAQKLEGVQILNCSRRTALTCFPQSTLETELANHATTDS